MHEKKKLRKGISLILSFFLAVSVLGLFLFLEVQLGFTGEKCMNEAISQSSYTRHAEEEMSKQIQKLLESVNLPETLAEQSIDEDKIYLEIKNYVDAVYDGKEASFDTEEFKTGLTQAINTYLVENNISVSEQLKQSMDATVVSAVSIYEQYLEPTFAKTFYDFTDKTSSKVRMIGIISLIVTIVIVAVMIKMYHYKHRALRYVIYSTIAAAGLNLMSVLAIGRIDLQKELGVGPKYYVNFLNQYLANGRTDGIIVTAAAVLLVVLLFLLNKYLKNTGN